MYCFRMYFTNVNIYEKKNDFFGLFFFHFIFGLEVFKRLKIKNLINFTQTVIGWGFMFIMMSLL